MRSGGESQCRDEIENRIGPTRPTSQETDNAPTGIER
jgi:hypothetical protein